MAKVTRSTQTRFLKSDTCKDATALLLDYLAGTLPPKVRKAFDEHLSICPDCVSFLRTYEKTIQLARSFLGRAMLAGKPPRAVPSHKKRSKKPGRAR